MRWIACEDTRVTRKLLTRFEIRGDLSSYHAHSSPGKREALVARLDEGDLALVSDAGTPGISDPGAALVAAARATGHEVVALPGPSAVTAALSISGLPADAYTFLGFLPRKKSERRRLLREMSGHRWTLVAFETPQRLRAALEDLAEVFGSERRIAVTRELTKRFEEVFAGTLDEARSRWAEEDPRGEFTLVVEGAPAIEAERWDDERVRQALEALRTRGLGPREASRELAAEAGRTAREIYALWDHDGA